MMDKNKNKDIEQEQVVSDVDIDANTHHAQKVDVDANTHDVIEYPRKLDRPFLYQKKGFFKKTEGEVPELKEYVLLLMKNNGHTDFIEGVTAGEFLLQNAHSKEEKTIVLTPNKLTTINYNNQYFKGWIAHEDNVSPYPQEPLHNAEMYRKTVQKLAMNYRDANEAKYLEAKAKMWIWIALGGLVVGYIIFLLARNMGWMGGGTEVDQAVVQTAQNLTEAVEGVSVE